MTTQLRHPEGTPVGGQFALAYRAGPAITLAASTARPNPADAEQLQAMAGIFADGYDDEGIDTQLSRVRGTYLACLWAEKEEGEYSGDSEIIGLGPDGTWRQIHPLLWEHLTEPDSQIDVASTPLLGDVLYDQTLTTRDHSHNLAASDMDACIDCGQSNLGGEGFDGLCGDCADRAEDDGEWDDD